MKRDEFIKGVNLGGWLVLERWITPSLFQDLAAKDEWSFMQEAPNAPARIDQHRREFITEADFAWIGASGLNAVRLPLGYWWNQSDGPFQECLKYVDFAVEMCEKYDLKLLLDMHAAPGSQNGMDHSGRIGAVRWQKNPQCRQHTLASVRDLVARYREKSCIWGIELLNEPRPMVLNLALRSYYRQAEKTLRQEMPTHWRLMFHDSFTPRLLSGVLPRRTRQIAAMDIHWYHMTFWLGSRVSIWWYEILVRYRKWLIRALKRRQEVYIGEFSGALNWDIIGKLPEPERMQRMRDHVRLQLAVYAAASGWFYWNYKHENSVDEIWNFRSEYAAGVFSDVLEARKL